MQNTALPLGELSAEEFLRDYWQKKPLVIRNAFPGFKSPISADELAGLACEEDVNSRLVIEKDGDHPWQPVYGPMDDEIFGRLPDTHWTLLVNDVEKHLPELAWIVDQFRFIPEWRVDDLMISYAPLGGSVGPHMDLYDVFILQADGHRRWQINSQPVADDNQVEGTPLRIQKNFEAEQEWLLEPGDLIYIPPGVSHHGVATDDCMSYSIGFRSTSHADMVNDFIGFITQDLPTDFTYQDADLKLQAHPNEITQDALANVREIFNRYLNPDHPELLRWFGRFSSDTKTEIEPIEIEPLDSLDELQTLLGDAHLYRHPGSRYTFARLDQSSLLFVDGEDIEVSTAFAECLCRQRQLDLTVLLASASDNEKALLLTLYNQGKLYIES